MEKGRRAVLLAAMGLALVAFLEVIVDLLALASPRVATILASPAEPAGIPDPRLGTRPNPLFVGHDADGFRNAFVPSQADIVAFGDSQTYGTGVSGAAAWPSILRSTSGRSVYSIAFGGFGPVHTLLLWEDGLKLHPHTIIEALYTGNDLYDAFDMVYNRRQFEMLKTADPDVQRQIRTAQDAEPLVERVNRIVALCRPVPAVAALTTTPESSSYLRDALRDHSGLYGLARRTWFVVQDLAAREQPDSDIEWREELALAEANPASCQSFDDGVRKTIFTPEYRLAGLDLEDIRISEGARVALAAIGEMQKRATAVGIRFVLLEIPTKELVFYPLVAVPTASYTRLVENEQRFREHLHDYLRAAGIESIDALPALREVFNTGSSPYQSTSDGHPNEHGHGAIASLVESRLSSDNALATEAD